MKTIRKKISAVLLSVYMVFGVVSTDYLEVQAFEWIVPAIGIEEALKFLLLALGVCVGGEVASEIDWSTLKEDCITFQENQGNSQVAVSQWWADVLSGKLNQASDCWTSFKEWVHSLSSNASLTQFTTKNATSIMLSSLNIQYLETFTISNSDTVCSSAWIYPDNSTNTNVYHRGYYFYNIDNLRITENSSVYIISASDGSTFSYSFIDSITKNNGYITKITLSGSSSVVSEVRIAKSIFENTLSSYFGFTTALDIPNSIDVSTNVADSDYTFYNPAIIPNIDLAPSDSRDTAIPDVMPLPWENVGDTDDEINERINGVIDAVNTGNLSIADAMQNILDMLNALAVDTTSDGALVPENPDKPDETYPERVQENQDNFGFTLAGFEKLFPFCIPFDIYAFMTLLVAEPVAPVINWPIYNPITDSNEIIIIDFSTWESVVILLRYIFDFLFIIGLLLTARALIGGGDKA